MIDKNLLIELARLNNLRPWQQEKHYIQSLILVTLSDEPLVFKGGTYLWLFYGLKRFSEDLDFTSISALSSDLPLRVSKSIGLFGVENKMKIINNNERTLSFRISAKGPLNTSDIDLCHVYVEVSKREQVINKTLPLKFDNPAYQLPVKIINGMSLNEVAAEKVRAVMTRDKARDLHDLFYLIKNKGVIFNKELIDKKLNYYNMTFSPSEFIKSIKKKEKVFNKELNSLVLDSMPSFNNCFTIIKNWIK